MTAPALEDFAGDAAAVARRAAFRDDIKPDASTDLVAVSGQIWNRPSLRHIHDYARARRTSPWAVLGVAMARAVVATPPFVMLPPLVGSEASLNLFVALVGPSGSGKGAAEAAAADAIEVGSIYTAHAGSGEGIPHLFAHREKARVTRDRDAVLLTVPEVDSLTALGSRQGSTLLPVLRSAWSGERLGFANADHNRTLPIERHSYRLGLILGVQPARAAALLNDSDGGTPQRFLWLPTVDKHAPDVRPTAPAPRKLATHVWPGDMRGRHILPVPDVAKTAVDRATLARARGEGDPLEGHALLCRLKAAQGLALLDDRPAITDEDWQHAGLLMAVSDHTRSTVQRELAAAATAANLAKGRAEGLRGAVAADTLHDHAIQRVCQWVTRHLAKQPDETARGDVRKAMPSRDRQYFDEAIERLRAAGQINEITTPHGTRLATTEKSRP